MRFRSLRMKLSVDLVGIADRWWTNRGFLAFCRIQRTVAILGYGDFEIDNNRPLGVVSAFQFQIRVHFVYYMVEVVCCFFISCLDINVRRLT